MKVKNELQYLQDRLDNFESTLVKLDDISQEISDITEAFPIYFFAEDNIGELFDMLENTQENLRKFLGGYQK
jgi:hypothetical protein